MSPQQLCILLLCAVVGAWCSRPISSSLPSSSSSGVYNFAILSDIHIGDGSANATLKAKAAVKGINALVTNGTNIKMVFITGDLTNSALEAQWEIVTSILNDLKVPYYPIIGNHDMWSYNETSHWETEAAYSDQLFASYYSHILNGPEIQAYPPSTVYNPQQKIQSWFQNYYIRMGNNVYVCLDWNSREHAVSQLGYMGAMPTAELHDFEGGTFQWLHTQLTYLDALSAKQTTPLRIIMFQHHPFRTTPEIIPGFIYAFSEEKRLKILSELAQHTHLDFWGSFVGHFHMWWNGTAFGDLRPSFIQWETDACKNDDAFTLVTVDDTTGAIKNMQKMTGGGI
eukprot:TRINITY_DN4808_c0_g1_i2.p1 TRINITY_DN4808_c0_g1~~TRINITY_DN4808_c0_g1_i2.p1  ORF type:complete len:340 (-),score=82.17 TRINITY_DN4808_c0_g1_i2:60-1079(-)